MGRQCHACVYTACSFGSQRSAVVMHKRSFLAFQVIAVDTKGST